MKRFFVLLTIILIIFPSTSSANTKLYRNTQWQFRIELPYDWKYTKPKGPNVVMNAINKDIEGMNIVVKQMPYIAEADEDTLIALNEIQEYPSNVQLLNWKIMDISPHKALATTMLIHYKYPTAEFYSYSLMFQIITNGKIYTISYFCPPDRAKIFLPTILKSVGTFVDETNWY